MQSVGMSARPTTAVPAWRSSNGGRLVCVPSLVPSINQWYSKVRVCLRHRRERHPVASSESSWAEGCGTLSIHVARRRVLRRYDGNRGLVGGLNCQQQHSCTLPVILHGDARAHETYYRAYGSTDFYRLRRVSSHWPPEHREADAMGTR